MTPVRYYRPGGRTREFGDQPFYDSFVKRFRYEEQTALWNKGLGEEDIVRGLMEATGQDETTVNAWLVESSVERPIGKAVDLWAATRWHKEFPRYYAVVGRHMEAAHTAMGRAGAACLVKLMKLKTEPSYIDTGLAQRFSWQQLVYGVENGIALEYLNVIIPNRDEENDDDPYI